MCLCVVCARLSVYVCVCECDSVCAFVIALGVHTVLVYVLLAREN